ncbi:MAG TPA: hypothetical protein QF838_02585, partial [SAR202 cluster bacterium]|nr:hypothetical protein [SAR202 cluster bacterium]
LPMLRFTGLGTESCTVSVARFVVLAWLNLHFQVNVGKLGKRDINVIRATGFLYALMGKAISHGNKIAIFDN